MSDWFADLIDQPQVLLLLGMALIGIAYGLIAQWSRFCLLRGLLHRWQHQDSRKLQAFALAMATSLLFTQLARVLFDLDLDRSVFFPRDFSPLLVLLGGVIFGYGMTLANACGARSVVLLASGNLRSAVTLLALALGAGMTLSGILAPLRLLLDGLPLPRLSGVTLPELFGLASSWAMVVLISLLLLVLLAFCFLSCPRCRTSGRRLALDGRDALGGLSLGLLIALSWWWTGWAAQDPFQPQAPAALSFIAPIAQTQQYLLLSTGSRLNLGVVLVLGVFCGALVRALLAKEFRWQGFDSTRQTHFSLLGGFMMGVGGVLALGCSVGQGLSGFSTLALTSFFALAGILLGTRWAMRRHLSSSHPSS